ncbi:MULTISPECIES: TcfC E-set like domain-containing protein [Providencia]|uniref:TcfC E-set like domain-containing protein n=1 Tax=Providencia TaxID=586 RepID=UPI000D6FCC2C|nr:MULTISPECIES: TcfC E-set like domain-containing protein [Providencia]MCG5291455.1 TcfC E-set like domain-containing protein [Providencia rettgeri]MCX9096194.1 TcfC E-set like domain-containing protein [Providencia rettgeri]MDM9284916.1 TcfC E-set like domain-containing protein [Providencia rettgeri]WOB80887.1 TcfC E-set like domain-containing protein [Providencia sp. PROV114]HEE8951258.1 TcfC E-set like domain-containing protein [Providencia rettgeri]
MFNVIITESEIWRYKFKMCLLAIYVGLYSHGVKADSTSLVFKTPPGFENIGVGKESGFLVTYNGNALPGYVTYNSSTKLLSIDSRRYKENIFNSKDVKNVNEILKRINFEKCERGCEVQVDNNDVSIDKLNQTISIFDKNSKYITPQTNFGLVHNQTIDIKGNNDGYRSANISGNGYIGLPSQMYGYFNWYYNKRTYQNTQSSSNSAISTYYLQKNFDKYYVRAGKQNSLDYYAGAINSVISPSYNGFLTVGSQDNFSRENKQNGADVLTFFAMSEGSVDIERDGRVLLNRSSSVGKNEIDYRMLPSGYYPVEIIYFDKNGREMGRESQMINNVNYGNQGDNWHITAGKQLYDDSNILEVGVGHDMQGYYGNILALAADNGKWTTDININKPLLFDEQVFQPTIGFRAGEKGIGGYASLAVGNSELGSITASYYQQDDVSDAYYTANSSSISYSRNFGANLVSYSYGRFYSSDYQQLQISRLFTGETFYANTSLGVKRQTNFGDGVYLNLTLSYKDSQARLNIYNSSGDVAYSASYQKEWIDQFGSTTANIDYGHSKDNDNITLSAGRSGSLGELNTSVGFDRNNTQGSLYYRGGLSVSKYGVYPGRYNNSGSVLLVDTPANEGGSYYGFNVFGNPVTSGRIYSVPINSYKPIGYASVSNNNAEDIDMQIEVPVNVLKSHPGQVYYSKALVNINQIYSGFMRNKLGEPVSGTLSNGELVYRNGLFSFNSEKVLKDISLSHGNVNYKCDLTLKKDNGYVCIPL